jgi:hypothetical protein
VVIEIGSIVSHSVEKSLWNITYLGRNKLFKGPHINTTIIIIVFCIPQCEKAVEDNLYLLFT